ncbi:MAG TPA: HipA domain-containing protein [Opitutales bacterium]|nr:HipA domain-containing protein [Opitutales bacterium]
MNSSGVTGIEEPRAVIVKFSPKLNTSSGRRWADLLYAEHTANEVLREAGYASAKTRILQIGERVFLESDRFDRAGPTGRRGLVTLRAFDAAHLGMGQGSWAQAARKLREGKWISEDDCERIIRLQCFGQLIANIDMHWGNLSFFLIEQSPFPLAPVYDMLPMLFRPSSTGEVLEQEFKPTLPKPEDQPAWLKMHPCALTYWQRLIDHPKMTSDFKSIARAAFLALQQIQKIATG